MKNEDAEMRGRGEKEIASRRAGAERLVAGQGQEGITLTITISMRTSRPTTNELLTT